MMRLLFASILVVLLGMPLKAQAEPARYELDPTHTTIYFLVDHIGYAPTLGIFGKFAGEFVYDMDNQQLSDVSVTIQTDSVNTFLDARDKHVKNKDFLDVKNFPEITFVADSGNPQSENAGTVTGNLTILGQTHPITLSVKLNKAEKYPFGHGRFVLGLSLEGKVKRSRYGMNYAVANAFVGDEVSIRVETEAMRME